MKELFKLGGKTDYGKWTPIISFFGLLMILGIWWIEARMEIIPTKIFPGPFEVLGAIGNLVENHHLLGNIWFSVKMNLLAYFWAILASLPLGLLIAMYPLPNLCVGKYINAIRFLPLPATTALFISAGGLTYSTKLLFLVVALVIFILPEVCNRVNVLQNKNSSDFVYLETIKTLGATPWQMFRWVYWPYVTSGISGSIRSLAALSWSYVTISELIYKDGEINGIGALINTSFRQAHIPEAWVGLFLIIAIGVIQDFLFKNAEMIIFPYLYNKKRIL
jgi:NitT/TauT family transport system permease protein